MIDLEIPIYWQEFLNIFTPHGVIFSDCSLVDVEFVLMGDTAAAEGNSYWPLCGCYLYTVQLENENRRILASKFCQYQCLVYFLVRNLRGY